MFCVIWFAYLYSTIKNKNKPLILFVMKTNVHYSNVKPVRPEPTNMDLLKALAIILALAFLTIVVPFGHSFIDFFMNACFK